MVTNADLKLSINIGITSIGEHSLHDTLRIATRGRFVTGNSINCSQSLINLPTCNKDLIFDYELIHRTVNYFYSHLVTDSDFTDTIKLLPVFSQEVDGSSYKEQNSVPRA